MLGNQLSQSSGFGSSEFLQRHIGPTSKDQQEMLDFLEYPSLEEFVQAVVPSEILDRDFPKGCLPNSCNESKAIEELLGIARKNKVLRSLIGLGYHGTILPPLIQRDVLENPAWYTAYTPYQAEISQGRLEALFNFQTLISELTGLPIANASLLDEATAAAEAMSLSFSVRKNPDARRFLIHEEVLPQTLAVLRTRAEPLGIQIDLCSLSDFNLDKNIFGLFLQLPGCRGSLFDPSKFINSAHQVDALVSIAIDPMAQVLLAPVGNLGVDIAVGSIQRFGLPMAFGGPHAAFFATRETFKRQVPGRLVGQSVDSDGEAALRLALQTREQHIRRDKATSNICTAQVLLAVIASFYAVNHGPEGLESIARRIFLYRVRFEKCLKQLGYSFESQPSFDTIEVCFDRSPLVHELAKVAGFNLRVLPLGAAVENSTGFGITFDELTSEEEFLRLQKVFAEAIQQPLPPFADINFELSDYLSSIPLRNEPWLKQSVFNDFRSETELRRYIQRLVQRDFSLINGMIPLGSCTMKLNATSELIPIGWKEFADVHPFSPISQVGGYLHLFKDLEKWIAALTGFAATSLQPNAGSQGEFAGLLVIQAWHKDRGQGHRDICLIPTSAHGTNPASSVMAGMKVVAVACDQDGNIDFDDLTNKAELYSPSLSALMLTYPSTHGVFEPKIREICDLIHSHGGQVYLDGANLNAQVGLCKPGLYGADVCHLNLHKTFCIPHGGGGPGVGPIAVAMHLEPYLPGHPLLDCARGEKAIGAISAAPWGSAGILSISWMYIRMMGVKGLCQASSVALLSANYIAKRLDFFFPVLFKGQRGLVAHECILDLRPLKSSSGIEVDDVAKRLMDYGFHAPTVSWPVAGTLMVEPTESEALKELDRFCEAMIAIRSEIEAIELGEIDPQNNPLKKSPHTLFAVTQEVWNRPYSRQVAAFPSDELRRNKFWPAVSRINNVYGDRNLICSCPPMDEI